MPYRIMIVLNTVYPLSMFGVYILAFLLAIFFTVFMPATAILILIGAVIGLLPVWGIRIAGITLEHALARRCLDRGRCPICANPVDRIDGQELISWSCSGCGTSFGPAGNVFVPEPSTEPVDEHLDSSLSRETGIGSPNLNLREQPS